MWLCTNAEVAAAQKLTVLQRYDKIFRYTTKQRKYLSKL